MPDPPRVSYPEGKAEDPFATRPSRASTGSSQTEMSGHTCRPRGTRGDGSGGGGKEAKRGTGGRGGVGRVQTKAWTHIFRQIMVTDTPESRTT